MANTLKAKKNIKIHIDLTRHIDMKHRNMRLANHTLLEKTERKKREKIISRPM